MNATDYWPMAREYSIWNATVAALQFWTADLKAHVLSSTVEQVYNVFFYTTSMHLLHQQSEGSFYLVTSWPCLMPPLKANSPWKMKVMRVEVKILTYPLLSDVLLEYTMFPVMTTFPLTQSLHTVGVPASHITSPVWHQLSFNTSDDKDSSADDIPPTGSSIPPQNLLGFAQLTCYKPIYTMWWWPRRWRRRRRRRRRRFPDCTTRWWPLEYRRNAR